VNNRSCATFRLILCAILLGALGDPGSVYGAWQLVWSDEFNGTNIDATKWTFDIGNGSGGWGNSEREYYRTNNAYVTNGALHIAARQESFGGFPYTSARMKTQGLYSKKYGRIEFRARLPQGVGFWPALWMLGTNITSVSWPACGEVDVLENNGSWSNQVQGTIHYSDSGNNHLQQTRLYTLPTSGDSVTNFHLYAVEWTTNSIKWTVDAVTVQTWTSWSSSTGPYPAPFNQPFFIIMNVAVGGSYLGYPTDGQINAGTSFPGEMQVDYVRVYDDVPVTTPPNAPTGLAAYAGNAKVFLNWDASTSGATNYNVKRAFVAGGPYTAIAAVATNSYTDMGVSNCAIYYYVVSASNSFGQSTNSSEASVALGPFAVAVNSGGGAVNQFAADSNFSGGTQAAAVSATIDTNGLIAPAPQAVYQTERYGNFTYTFTGLMSGVSYKVRLHLAETYWTAVGQRRFNVFINGVQVLTNFDIIAVTGGSNRATIQEFLSAANSGQIVIQFVTVTDNAKCDGIEILLSLPPTPSASNNSPISAGMTLNLTASTVTDATYAWTGPNGFASTSQNPSVPNATTNAAGVYAVTATVGGCASSPATTTVMVNPPVTVSINSTGDGITIQWPSGILQWATNIMGPWNDLAGTNSPYSLAITEPQQFFRIKLQ
jgi:beta-glucanase (GH16 family)